MKEGNTIFISSRILAGRQRRVPFVYISMLMSTKEIENKSSDVCLVHEEILKCLQ